MSAPFERKLKKVFESVGFTVFRSAGSRAVDLIAIQPERGCFLIEEKSFTGDVFRVTKTKEDKEQWEQMCELEKKLAKNYPFVKGCPAGYFVFYALHKSRGGYRLILASDLGKPYHWSEDPAPAVPLEVWF